MRKKLIYSRVEPNSGYGGGSTERYEYECPCGNGKIIEEHDNIPGYREHNVFIQCEKCKQKYDIDRSYGVRNWEIKLKNEL